MIQTTVFARSLSNFACKLFMMRGGTLLIFGHGVKGQDQLWPPARGCHALRCLVYFTLNSCYNNLFGLHCNLGILFHKQGRLVLSCDMMQQIMQFDEFSLLMCSTKSDFFHNIYYVTYIYVYCEILELLQIYKKKSKFMLTYMQFKLFLRQVHEMVRKYSRILRIWCMEGRRGHLQFHTFSMRFVLRWFLTMQGIKHGQSCKITGESLRSYIQ